MLKEKEKFIEKIYLHNKLSTLFKVVQLSPQLSASCNKPTKNLQQIPFLNLNLNAKILQTLIIFTKSRFYGLANFSNLKKLILLADSYLKPHKIA
jgi:hypothetical protein